MRICVVHNARNVYSETFIRAHIELLPAAMEIYEFPPLVDGRQALSTSLLARGWRKAIHRARGEVWDWHAKVRAGHLAHLRKHRPDVVLAEYGPNGVYLTEPCHSLSIPLVVHFHGYDAGMRRVLEEHTESYPSMFSKAAAMIAVSVPMREQLIRLGAPPRRSC